MSFWNTSDGKDTRETGGDFELSAAIEPIPEHTVCTAMIDEAIWNRDSEGNSFIQLRWTIALPALYKNRKIFQKLWVIDDDPRAKDAEKKRNNSKKMLAAIDANTGGKLAKNDRVPTSDDLAKALLNRPMTIRIGMWKQKRQDTGEEMKGNFVAAVSQKGAVITPTPSAPPAKASMVVEDDSIPF